MVTVTDYIDGVATADAVSDVTKADLRTQFLEAILANLELLKENIDPRLVCLGSFGQGPLISTEYREGEFIQRTTHAGELPFPYRPKFTETEITSAKVKFNLNQLPESSLICAAAAAETTAAKYKQPGS